MTRNAVEFTVFQRFQNTFSCGMPSQQSLVFHITWWSISLFFSFAHLALFCLFCWQFLCLFYPSSRPLPLTFSVRFSLLSICIFLIKLAFSHLLPCNICIKFHAICDRKVLVFFLLLLLYYAVCWCWIGFDHNSQMQWKLSYKEPVRVDIKSQI